MRRLLPPASALRFAAVGCINTAVDFCLFVGLIYAWSSPPVLAHSLSYLAGAISSFVLNRYWTFDGPEAGSAVRQAVSFAGVSVVGLSFGAAIVWVISLNHSPVLAKVIATGTTFALNYALCRFIVFAKPVR